MNKFTAIKIGALGEFDQKYGQRYWGAVEESQMSVSFNLMTPVDIPPGAELEFEERVIKETGPNSKSPGTEYLFLKKVKVHGGMANQTETVPKTEDKLDQLIYEGVQEILRILNQTVPPKSLKEQWANTTKKEDTVVDVDPEEPIDLGSIPF